MKKNLFNITQDYQNIMDSILDNDGELTEELESALEINQDELTEKARGYNAVINDLQSKIDFIEKEEARLKKHKDSYNKTIVRLKEAIQNSMQIFEVESIDTGLNKFSIKKTKSLSIDLDLLPKKYFNAVPRPAKKPLSKPELKDLLKEGVKIKGVEWVTNEKLQIK